MTTMVAFTCVACGRESRTTLSHYNAGGGKLCSRACKSPYATEMWALADAIYRQQLSLHGVRAVLMERFGYAPSAEVMRCRLSRLIRNGALPRSARKTGRVRKSEEQAAEIAAAIPAQAAGYLPTPRKTPPPVALTTLERPAGTFLVGDASVAHGSNIGGN